MPILPIPQSVTELFADTFEKCGYPRRGATVLWSRQGLGQLQCNGLLAVASRQRKKPQELFEPFLQALDESEMLADVSMAGKGFINITLSDDFLASYVGEVANDERLGLSPVLPQSPESPRSSPRRVMIDFGGPNVAKPMHVGHLRSSIIGDCLQRLFKFMGDDVMSDIHLGDWGTQMGMLICELRRRQPELPYFDRGSRGPYPSEPPVSITDLEEMYPVASLRTKEDPQANTDALQATVELQNGNPGYRALWRHFVDLSVRALRQDFAALGVSFDLWRGESDYQARLAPMVEELQRDGRAVGSEGAIVVLLEQESEAKGMPPLLLEKSGGGYLYATTDLATIEERVHELQRNLLIYVVDKRQGLHFKQLFAAASRTGIASGDGAPGVQFEHVAFGTVNGPDGKPFKTRQGGVMRLGDLIAMAKEQAYERMIEAGVAQLLPESERIRVAEKVALAALKFADLRHHYARDYIFDLKKFTSFEGQTGPYLLYASVRIQSILRKARARQEVGGAIVPPKSAAERNLMLELSKLADVVQQAYENRAPNLLCDFAYDLARAYTAFYEACHILREPDADRRRSWLALSELSLKELEMVLNLLGIEIPDRM